MSISPFIVDDERNLLPHRISMRASVTVQWQKVTSRGVLRNVVTPLHVSFTGVDPQITLLNKLPLPIALHLLSTILP